MSTVELLVERWRLSPDVVDPLRRLVRLVSEDPAAPTAIRTPRQVVDDHLADSLSALDLAEVRRARLIADLGAGAGFPGLPLAIALPEAHVSLVESNAKKCAFMRRTIAELGVSNATVVNARAEEWNDGLRRHDLVTARALASAAVVVEYAAPLLRLGGVVVAWRGRRDPEAERRARAAASELGLEAAEPMQAKPYSAAEERFLHVFLKVLETPERFPRRAGVAAKRPLGDLARHD